MSTKTRLLGMVSGVAAGALVLHAAPRPAEACGGCFAPPRTITSVESHRMVISLDVGQTILWDQIRYSGNPADFVWVLPVPTAVADIEVADPTWFDELDVQTAPQIFAPPLPQPQGCASPPPFDPDDGVGLLDGAAASVPDAGVTVHEQATVGPYQMVIVSSDDATALQTWLVDHDYAVPPATIPTIDHYVQQDAKFVVLRLSPGQDVSAMQPVRVRYPGYMARFPLKMVTVGAAGVVDMTLWVVGDQRMETKGEYTTVEILTGDLTWDWALGRSDYAQVYDAKIDAAGGKAWVVQSSMQMDALFFSEPEEPQYARANRPYAYVTRLSTRMLADHIDADLELGLSAQTGDVPLQHFLTKAINVPEVSCPDWNGDGYPDLAKDQQSSGVADILNCRVSAGGVAAAAPLGLLAFAALALLRRGRRR